MASPAHCAFCFETLAAEFEGREPLRLAQVEDLWDEYQTSQQPSQQQQASANPTHPPPEDREDGPRPKHAKTSHHTDSDTVSTAAASTPPSQRSETNTPGSGSSAQSAASSATSLSESESESERHEGKRLKGAFPLFVTWNTHSRKNGQKSLRGCIGTFSPLELEEGLRSYALTSAFSDHRFAPIPSSLLPQLSVHVTLLTNFSSPSRDPRAWILGQHGIRISFTHDRRRLGATYLPDVPPEQGWTPEETLVSLMRKAGWSGREGDWERVWEAGRGELVTYEGKQVGLGFAEWRGWREWVDGRG